MARCLSSLWPSNAAGRHIGMPSTSDDLLEMLSTNYLPLLIAMFCCCLAALYCRIHGLAELLKLRNNATTKSEVATKGTKLRRFEAAMEGNDLIMAGLPVTVDEIKLLTDDGVPAAVVQGFIASQQMGPALMKQHRVADAIMHNCIVVNDPSTGITGFDGGAENKGTMGVADSFSEWKTQSGASEPGYLLEIDNVLRSCGKAKTLKIDLVNMELALDVRGTFSGLSVQDPQGVSKRRDWSNLHQDFIHWMRLCEVTHFTCPTSDFVVNFLTEIINCKQKGEQFPNLESIILSPGCEISDKAMENLRGIIQKEWPVLTGVSLHVGDLSADGMRLLGEAIRAAPKLQSIGFIFQGSSYGPLPHLAETIRLAPQSQTIKLSLAGQDDSAGKLVVAAIRQVSNLEDLSIPDFIADEAVILLSEAIKHVKALRKIDLSFRDLSDTGMTHLRKVVKDAPSVHTISLYFQKISDAGMELLSEAIQHVPRLENISFGCQEISDAGMELLSGAIQKKPALQSINITLSQYGEFSDAGMEHLSKAIQCASVLKNISLDCQTISAAGMTKLIEAIQKKPALENISLSCAEISAAGMELLSKAILQAPVLQNISISTWQKEFCDASMEHLSEAIQHASALQKVTLWCGAILAAGMTKLIEAIKKAPALQNISLTCQEISDPFMKLLSEAIQTKPVLQNISIGPWQKEISDAGMKLLSEAIQNAPAFQSISIGLTPWNKVFSDACVEHLSKAIENAPELQSISIRLSYGVFSDVGMERLSEAIKNASALQNISLACDEISAAGMKLLSEAIQNAPVLQNIRIGIWNIWKKDFSKACMEYLSKAIQNAPALQSISLDCRRIPDDVTELLREAIRPAPAKLGVKLLGFDGDRSLFDGLGNVSFEGYVPPF
eukprot:CAMPEP_0204321332 /NCGR_PEP_ID=MMETSP0469-20131031/8098_1 /ASSEMBLY_ACC=CAM_ASM_000384 /TAXON_ID=2969 /ORGANISM="Oxyrrhis marina" /LENGTH=894 /DNA_ID=CAMNT_0051302609 /DNA_START=43 /DNA_END=2727 /DNA_ORIENTATION=-